MRHRCMLPLVFHGEHRGLLPVLRGTPTRRVLLSARLDARGDDLYPELL